jgi:hypothetical protein
VNDTISGLTHNPTNSTTHECGSAGIFLTDLDGSSKSFLLASSADGAVLPGVTRVLQIVNPSGSALCGTMPADSWTNQSYCTRGYMMIDASSNPPCGNETCDPGCGANCGRVKMPRWHSPDLFPAASGPHPGFEASSESACDGVHDCGFDWSVQAFSHSDFGNDDLNLGGLTLTYFDFQGDWIRVELCWDHWTGGALANKMQSRVKLTRITGSGLPETATSSHISSGTSTTIESLGGSGSGKSPLMFCAAPSIVGNITEYFSYGMVTKFASTTACAADVADCLWIGAASEIEGSGGGTPNQGSGGISISEGNY